ncbi:Fizzy/cell division cycle 20 related 1 [Strongyloides ratti]|uniref:Fizzy/cell division cycle 20 related 1 n=1 Tax=Strongyloides ratti TaxID=34506 RepID=A0A090KYS9_STRRB|nr:Fizzy/cell division cycle 20 related 1 [Strongyloides ratti]CEF62665.1 Fizzy/cell division cycle 20 related 1 [Strongyloides ratti]
MKIYETPIKKENICSPLACLVSRKAIRKTPTKYVGSDGSINYSYYPYSHNGGDRYIPLRETQEDWSSIWSEGLQSSIFSDINDNENDKRCKIHETRNSPSKNQNHVHKLLLRNEMLNSNIYKIDKKSIPGYCNASEKIANITPLFKYGCGRIQKRRHEYKANIVTSYPCPFSQASLYLLTQNVSKKPKIPSESYRTLDAPDLIDDFYSNLIDWSSKNIIAVCLKNRLFLYDALTSEVTQLCDATEDIASVKFSPSGELIAFGTRTGEIKVWDLEKKVELFSNDNEFGRIGNLAWGSRGILSLATKSGYIINLDQRNYNNVIHRWKNHKYEVCGIQWNSSGDLLASGGNDNIVNIWNVRKNSSMDTYNEHTAAVKALSWSHHNNAILATGGGTSCKTIYIRDTNTGSSIKSVKTNSQICTLLWSKNTFQLVTTHGYQEHAVIVWDYPSMKPWALLKGHEGRVLYSAMSPNGQSVITGSNDESLRWWKLFPNVCRNVSTFRSKIVPYNLNFSNIHDVFNHMNYDLLNK